MLLPLSPDTVRNFLPQGARLILTSKHIAASIILSRAAVKAASPLDQLPPAQQAPRRTLR